jgi:hypothetical protein
MGRIVAGDHDTPAKQRLRGMTARERHRLRQQRGIRRGLAQTDGFDNLALDEVRIRLARDRLDDEAEQPVAVIGIFEAGVGIDRRRQREFGAQLVRREIGPGVGELTGIMAVAHQPRTVRQQLRQSGRANIWMQVLHVGPDGIVELQLLALAQAHDAGGGESLAVRGDPEAMARRQFLAAVEIGIAERGLHDDLAAMGDRDHAAGLPGHPDLELQPVPDVIECRAQPSIHVAIPPQ